MPALASSSLSNAIVLHGGRCVLIFARIYRGEQFTLRTDHRSLRWLQKFRNSDGMLARWYMFLGQFSVTFEYQPGAQHANADGLSHQCDQCLRPDCPVLSWDIGALETRSTSELAYQPFAASVMGDSMDSDLLPELFRGKHGWPRPTWTKLLVTCPHPVRIQMNKTLTVVRDWVRVSSPPSWSDCAGLSPELRLWHLQFGNVSIDLDDRLWRRRAPPAVAE